MSCCVNVKNMYNMFFNLTNEIIMKTNIIKLLKSQFNVELTNNSQETYVVHVDDNRNFEVSICTDNRICFNYFCQDDDDYSELILSADDITYDTINDIISQL